MDSVGLDTCILANQESIQADLNALTSTSIGQVQLKYKVKLTTMPILIRQILIALAQSMTLLL